ncbi:AMP-binding protein [Lichenibacterium ramalinae]|uniref:AMP-dependent synthetase n=1 Tax=Lichenibacterium ramalinae TaxID=2316527 RepID=A0A4Q2RHF3_9HYPH|nr:AMP-binding protein [Lichenibacterium ramalinae]RYB06142.1 AMP-dependent synthetase [Lichenibacterium ramalinae]
MTSFAEARAFLLRHREDYEAAVAGFRWPDATDFNWALDWFDAVLATEPDSRDRPALRIVDLAAGTDRSIGFADLSRRSNRVANLLAGRGIAKGDRVVLLAGSVQPLWEAMLAAMKLGAVVIPATTALTASELGDRLERGRARAVVAAPDQAAKCEAVASPGTLRFVTEGPAAPGWTSLDEAEGLPDGFAPAQRASGEDPLLLYFTSGTTALPKLVRHSHASYPVGALSTLYWLGLKPGDLHLNVSSPGWAKHAWSSVFAPWAAGATVVAINQPRFEAAPLLAAIARCGVTTLCAPPTAWRLFVQEDLAAVRTSLREVCGAGEPLNPEVIETVRRAWGLTIRDGYGQTETTAQVGNSPGQPVKPGAMGRPLPGYVVDLLDPDGRPAAEGEVCLRLGASRPLGLMQGYEGEGGTVGGADGALFRTGDVAFRDADRYLTFVGRADDVFKSSDYRISPFELESVLVEHPAVIEAAVVPRPDPLRLAVPVAYVIPAAGAAPDRATALSIFRLLGARLAPFKRVRHIVFVDALPKTISGKIRRVELRRRESAAPEAAPSTGAAVFDLAGFTADDLAP